MWFVETAWPPIIISLVISAVFINKWNQSQKKSHLIIAIILLVMTPVIFLAEQQIVTESERLEIFIDEFTTAFQQNDLKNSLSYIAPKNVGDRNRLKKAINFIEISDDLRITDVKVKTSKNGLTATTHFRANSTVSFKGNSLGHHPSRWLLTWEKANNQWKIIHIEQLHVVNGQPIRIPI